MEFLLNKGLRFKDKGERNEEIGNRQRGEKGGYLKLKS